MNTNINIKHINRHFFSNSDNIKKKQEEKTKIIKYCFYSLNELNICKKIKKIQYYINNFLVIEDYDNINISQLNDTYIDKINISNDSKYLIFTYKNENLIDFNDFLYNLITPKQFIFHLIQSFQYLLDSLIVLNENNICFFNLSPKNIVFNLDNGEKPILSSFEFSLQISKLNEDYLSNIIKNLDDQYIYKPFEVHILFYLIKNNIDTISYSFIEEVCEIFVDNLSILHLFPEKYKKSYKNTCVSFLKKYINKPKTYIISDILKYYDKWDMYSISVLYIHIFGSFLQIFSLKGSFISKIVIELSKNIHPDPSKRLNLNDFREKYNILFDNETNWDFSYKLPSNKMTELYEVLEK